MVPASTEWAEFTTILVKCSTDHRRVCGCRAKPSHASGSSRPESLGPSTNNQRGWSGRHAPYRLCGSSEWFEGNAPTGLVARAERRQGRLAALWDRRRDLPGQHGPFATRRWNL
jgi:hypothetical protein